MKSMPYPQDLTMGKTRFERLRRWIIRLLGWDITAREQAEHDRKKADYFEQLELRTRVAGNIPYWVPLIWSPIFKRYYIY